MYTVTVVVLGPKSGLVPRFELSRSHTIRHTHPVGLRRTGDQIVAEAATYTTHNEQNKRTSMPAVEFEPAISAIERPKSHA
jgi:hypothetical protein